MTFGDVVFNWVASHAGHVKVIYGSILRQSSKRTLADIRHATPAIGLQTRCRLRWGYLGQVFFFLIFTLSLLDNMYR